MVNKTNKRKIVAIIQARMGSNRLPGKAMMEISGKPMLAHVVERLRFCTYLDDVVIATSISDKDDAIEKYCNSNEIHVFRGSENDVLERYCGAARKFGADVVVRITSDCPLIDPGVTDKVIETYISMDGAADGATNTVDRTYPRGLDTEVFSIEAIEKAREMAKEPYQREHVTIGIYENRDLFTIVDVKGERDLSGMRWTVDEDADMRFAREIYKRLYDECRVFLFDEIVELLEADQALGRINAHIEQKSAK